MSNKIKILKALMNNGPMNNKSICLAVGISKPTATTLLNDLVNSGYVNIHTLGRSNIYSTHVSKPHDALAVFFGRFLIGYFFAFEKEYGFRYDAEYLIRPTIPYRLASVGFDAEMYRSEVLFYDFDGIMPEGVDRDILIAKTGSASDFDLLAAIDYDNNELRLLRPESAAAAEPDSSPYRKIPFSEMKTDILGTNDFPHIYANVETIDESILFPPADLSGRTRYTGMTMSLSGFQHKFGLALGDEMALNLSQKGHPKTHFVKPYYKEKSDPESQYYLPHLAVNEHLHLTFAKNELGFDVAETGIFKNSAQDKEYHFITKMFDRSGTLKYDVKEVATLIGVQTENKYKISAEEMFAKVAYYLRSQDEAQKFVSYFFYSFLIKHADMHTKNLAIVVEYANGTDMVCSMAPLYDIATTSVYPGLHEIESSLKIGNRDRDIRYDDFFALARLIGVGDSDFKRIAAAQTEIYIQKMPEYYEKTRRLDLKVMRNRYPYDFTDLLLKAHGQRIRELFDRGWIHALGLKIFTAQPEKMKSFSNDAKALSYLQCCKNVVEKNKILSLLTEKRMVDSIDALLFLPEIDRESNTIPAGLKP